MMSFSNQTPTPEEMGRYGFGTTQVVDKLLTLIDEEKRSSGKGDVEFLLLFNTATMIRNRFNRSNNFNQIINDVTKDIDGIKREFGELLRGGSMKKYLIFFDMPYEDQFKKELLRPDSVQRSQIRAATRVLRSTLPAYREPNGSLETWVVHSQSKLPSYLGIRESINQFPVLRPVMHLMSHVPVDYHLFHWYQGSIIKSFTGEILLGKSMILGNYVFKRNIPFTIATHLLLGDRELLKGTLTPKQKKALEELSNNERWEMRTDGYIEDSLRNNGYQIPYLKVK